jgi:hypothetical protein
MSDAAVAAAHERMAEQLMSDERILGALPEDSAGVLLDWALARLDDAADTADSVDAFAAAADAIRREARTEADAAADRGDDAAALTTYLREKTAAKPGPSAGRPSTVPALPQPVSAERRRAGQISSPEENGAEDEAVSRDARAVRPHVAAPATGAGGEGGGKGPPQRQPSRPGRRDSWWSRMCRFFGMQRGDS